MATYTTNLNLKKPATTDKIRIADFNNNSDLIDAAHGDQDVSLGKLGGGMAIIATGNVHGAISAGQFVYVRKHGTLTEGLYTADSNISANATLSTSNLTAVSGGGLNSVYASLNSNIANLISSSSVGQYASRTLAAAGIFGMMANGTIKFGTVGVTGVSNYMFLAFKNSSTYGVVVLFNHGNIVRIIYTTDGNTFEEKSLTAS